MRQVLDHGAVGFVTKSSQTQELLGAIRQVLAGDIYLPPELQQISSAAVVTETPQVPPSATESVALALTPRQEEVLYLLLEGRSNRDISLTLDLSEETVKNHITKIFRCFGVQTRTQAVLTAGSYGYSKSTPHN
jgi:DNA-binding NarL/FixJ family response regulator